MPGTDSRNLIADLLTLLADNTADAISEGDVRAIVKSFPVNVDTVAPVATDDASLGYNVGDFWLETTAPVTLYQCEDNTATAAVWTKRYPLTPADIGAATSAQGTLADSAVQPNDDVTTLGSGATASGYVPKADGAGGVAWAAESGGSGSGPLTINAQTGTAYTLALSDAEGMVTLDNAAAITVTVPPNSSVAFPVGTTIALTQLGAGQVTVAAGAGVTINSYNSLLSIAGQNLPVSLTQIAADTWLLTGALA